MPPTRPSLPAPDRGQRERELEGYRFTVPGDPVSVNRMYGNRRGGGKYLLPEAQAWKDRVAAAAISAGVRVCEGPMVVSLVYRHRYPVKRCDLDNIAKILLDGMNRRAYRDDRQVLSVNITAEHDPVSPGIEVWVRRARGEEE